MDAKKIEDLKTVLDMYMSEFTEEKESEEESIEEKEQEGEDKYFNPRLLRGGVD